MSIEVPPTGPTNAKIAFVGEAPGKDEIRAMQPFVGPTGQMLNQMLSSVGIDRRQCYLTNVVRERPDGNDFGKFYFDTKRTKPTPLLEASIQRLKDELVSIRPNVIVALGAEPLRAITGHRSITNWRGSILRSLEGIKLIPTYHPAYVLRVYEARPIVELDLRRVVEESLSIHTLLPRVNFTTRPTCNQVLQYLEKRPKRIAFDIETTQNFVRCLGLSDAIGSAICIPFVRNATQPKIGSTILPFLAEGYGSNSARVGLNWNYWSEEEEREILNATQKLFEIKDIEFVAQNAPFDTTVLESQLGLQVRGRILDTMLMHHCVYPELPKGLDFLASIYTRYPYYSDYDASNDEQVWTYNCYDAATTFEVSEVLDNELEEGGLAEFYESHIQPTSLAMTRTQNRGVLIDTVERSKQLETITEDITKLTSSIRQMVNDPSFNPSSPKQVGIFLYQKLKLPVVRNHKTGQPTTGKDAMESLARKHTEHEALFNALQKHSSLETVRSGFLSKQLGVDNRIFTSFNTAGTTTGRLSSSESFWLGASTNLQNIRKPSNGADRRCFIADKGFLLLKADLSQAEFRIVVWLAKIERLIREYKENPNFDVHTWVASLIYRKDKKDVKKHERDIAKNGVYGGNYSMAATTAARTYKLPLQVARFVLDEYRKAIPEIPTWWETVKRCLLSTRTITNPFGRRRLFFGRCDDDMFRAGYSHSAQSIVADVINRAISLADEIFDPSEAQILLQVHDEILVQVKETLVRKYSELLRRLMEYPIYFEGVSEPLIIPADIKIGPNWLDVKELK